MDTHARLGTQHPSFCGPQSQLGRRPATRGMDNAHFSCVIPGALWHAGGEQTQAEGGGERATRFF